MTKTTDSSPVRIMIDLETLSTGPTAAVVQIAAVRFDESGAIASDLEAYVENARFEAGIKISDALQFGNVDGATLSWWLEQSDFARADLVRGRDSLKTALMLFEDWLPEQFELWCHATFDEPILRNAYIALGLDVPWTRHQVFDLRTLLYLAPTEIEADRGPRHVALQDAMYMARQAGAALGRQEAVRRFLEVWKSPVSAPKEPTTGDSKCQP